MAKYIAFVTAYAFGCCMTAFAFTQNWWYQLGWLIVIVGSVAEALVARRAK